MSGTEDVDPPDPLAILDALLQFRENLRGMVAAFMSDGFTEAQARDLVVVALKLGPAS